MHTFSTKAHTSCNSRIWLADLEFPIDARPPPSLQPLHRLVRVNFCVLPGRSVKSTVTTSRRTIPKSWKAFECAQQPTLPEVAANWRPAFPVLVWFTLDHHRWLYEYSYLCVMLLHVYWVPLYWYIYFFSYSKCPSHLLWAPPHVT